MRRWMLAAAVAALLAAAGCGTDEPPAKGDEASAPIVPKGPVKGDLTIAQWPLYIDPGKRGTVAEFEQSKQEGYVAQSFEDLDYQAYEEEWPVEEEGG